MYLNPHLTPNSFSLPPLKLKNLKRPHQNQTRAGLTALGGCREGQEKTWGKKDGSPVAYPAPPLAPPADWVPVRTTYFQRLNSTPGSRMASWKGRKRKEFDHQWAPRTKPFTCRLPGRKEATSSKQAQRIRSPHSASLTHTFRRHLAQLVEDRGPWSQASSRVHSRLLRALPDPKHRPSKSLVGLPSHSHGTGPGGWQEQIVESQRSPAAHTRRIHPSASF